MGSAAGPQWLTSVGAVCVAAVAVVTFIRIIGNDSFDEGLRRLLLAVFAIGVAAAIAGGCWWIYQTAENDDPTATNSVNTTPAAPPAPDPRASSTVAPSSSAATTFAPSHPVVGEDVAVEFVGAFLRAADDTDPTHAVEAWESMLTESGRLSWAADESSFTRFWRDVVDNVNPRSLVGSALPDGTAEVTGVLEYAVLPGAHECYPDESVEEVRFVVLRGVDGELRVDDYAHNNERCEPG